VNLYQQRALEGASGVELTVALYDGIIRFMREAAAAVDRDDVSGRRRAVKRAMDILVHLQGTLRMDLGGKTAETLAEFYTASFALMLQGSMECSKAKFERVIAQVWEVREAWRKVAADPDLAEKTAAELHRLQQASGANPRQQAMQSVVRQSVMVPQEREASSSWTA